MIDSTGKPLQTCCECNHNLTDPQNGVRLSAVIADKMVDDIPSHINADGSLADTKDGIVKKGFLSGVRCGGCGCYLDEMSDVVNGQDNPNWQDKQASIGEGCTLPYGIVVTVDNKCGTIESKLSSPDDNAIFRAACDVIESFVLACACHGINVHTPEFVEVIEDVVSKVADTYGDD
jgi:hypothetical protein